jgi:Na+-driven multidrug efflux pump
MAAYSLTFNLGFATSQFCESISVAAQALLAKEFPIKESILKNRTVTDTIVSDRARFLQLSRVKYIIKMSLFLGLLVSSALAIFTLFSMNKIVSSMSSSFEVQSLVYGVMPIVLWTQLFKGLAYASGGTLLGGKDWKFSTLTMIISSVISVLFLQIMSWGPTIMTFLTTYGGSIGRFIVSQNHYLMIFLKTSDMNLEKIWATLLVFMTTQVICALVRIFSRTGPWKDVKLI